MLGANRHRKPAGVRFERSQTATRLSLQVRVHSLPIDLMVEFVRNSKSSNWLLECPRGTNQLFGIRGELHRPASKRIYALNICVVTLAGHLNWKRKLSTTVAVLAALSSISFRTVNDLILIKP